MIHLWHVGNCRLVECHSVTLGYQFIFTKKTIRYLLTLAFSYIFSTTPHPVSNQVTPPQVLNRSLETRTSQSSTPSAAPTAAEGLLPAVALVPQHVITSGTAKDCVRLRGLPYEAQVSSLNHHYNIS